MAGKWPDVEGSFEDSPCHHIAAPPSADPVDFSNINILELWPILVGLKRWYPLLSHSTIIIYTDSTLVKYMLRKGVSANKTCMSWLRELYWLCVIYDIHVETEYINTKDNVLADALSRMMYSSHDGLDDNLTLSGLCCISEIRVVPGGPNGNA